MTDDVGTDDGYAALEQTLGRLIRTARSNIRAIAAELGEDMDPASYTLLGYLLKNPDVRLSDIADAQCVGKPTISRQIARLEKMGLVERTTDPADSRGQLARLTADASERIQTVREGQAARLRETMSGWPESDVETLTELLGRFVDDFLKSGGTLTATALDRGEGAGYLGRRDPDGAPSRTLRRGRARR